MRLRSILSSLVFLALLVGCSRDGDRKRCDIDRDGVFDKHDYSAFTAALGSDEGDAAYNRAADWDHNGGVRISDFGFFRRQCPPIGG